MSINHRAEALRLLDEAATNDRDGDWAKAKEQRREALVHATLASGADPVRDQLDAMRDRVSRHIATALPSCDYARAVAARDLARVLDLDGVNLDDLIDQHLTDDGYNPKEPWDGPSIAAPAYDRRMAKPDTADIPEPVRRVLAGHLAEMLLDHGGDNGSIRTWARGITDELRREGLDLSDAIKRRITDITLGPQPEDPPF